jgi:hypothetical protein
MAGALVERTEVTAAKVGATEAAVQGMRAKEEAKAEATAAEVTVVG